MELIDIVDENGNLTGETLEKKEAHDKNLLHNEVACMVINRQKQVLLQKRAATKRFGANKYALLAGHVDFGESLEDAMIREIKEEIGIDVKKEDLKPYLEREFFIGTINSHVTYFYYIICDLKEDEFIIQKEELSEVKWFDPDDVIYMLRNHDEKLNWGEEKIPLFEGVKNIKISE